MMIHDDDVSIDRALAHARDEARIVVRTLLPETSIRTRIDVSPERQVLRQVREFSAIAGFCLRHPAKDFIKLIDLIQAFKNRRALSALDAVETRVIVPP